MRQLRSSVVVTAACGWFGLLCAACPPPGGNDAGARPDSGAPGKSCPVEAPPECVGDFQIEGGGDFEDIDGCLVIEGNVTIEGPFITNSGQLAQLSCVSESLTFRNTGFEDIDGVDGFRQVGNLVIENLEELEDATFPNMLEVFGDIRVEDNLILTNLSLPALNTVGGSFRARDNPQLPQCQLDALVGQVGEVETTFSGNDDNASCP